MLNNKDVHTIENKDINIVICCPDQIAFWLTGLYITTSYGMWSALSRPICQNHSAMPRKSWQRLYQVKLKIHINATDIHCCPKIVLFWIHQKRRFTRAISLITYFYQNQLANFWHKDSLYEEYSNSKISKLYEVIRNGSVY